MPNRPSGTPNPARICSCGRGFDLYDGGVLGLVDDARVVGRTSVDPRGVEMIVRGLREVVDYELVISTWTGIDEVVLRIEPPPGCPDSAWQALESALHERLAAAYNGVRFGLERVVTGTLSWRDADSDRFKDLRSRGDVTAGRW